MKFRDKIKIKEGSRRYFIYIPCSIALAMTILCYYYWNARYTFELGDNAIRLSSAFKDLCTKTDYSDDEVLAINVSYDRVLVPYSISKLSQGTIDITDRYKLLVLLDSLSKWNNYKYIACDVRFDDQFTTEWDEALFKLISEMRDITVARGKDDSYPSILSDKVSNSSYSELLSGDGFLKFSYKSSDNMDNMAYRMWKEIDGGRIKKHWWGYSSGGWPCVSSFVPDLKYSTRINDSSRRKANYNLVEDVYNLGASILSEFYEDPEIYKLFDNKIILIGDFKEADIHDTIKNRIAGPEILFNEYLGLKNGAHKVRIWVMILLFLVFSAEISYVLRDYWLVRNSREEKKKRKLLRLILKAFVTWIGYTGVLGIVCIIIYFYSGLFVNAIVIGSIIAFMSSFIKSPEK